MDLFSEALNIFHQQYGFSEVKDIKVKFHNVFQGISNVPTDLSPFSSVAAIVFSFMTENIRGMPIDIRKELVALLEAEIKANFGEHEIRWLTENNRNKKKLVNFIQGVFELIGVYLSVR